MGSRILPFVAVVSAIQSLAAFATSAPRPPLQPSSKWNVDYDVAQCTASRDYGTPEKPLLFVLKPSPFGGVMRLIVVRKVGYAGFARELEGFVQLDDRPRAPARTLKFGGNGKMTLYSVNLRAEEFAAKPPEKSVALSTNEGSYRFAVDSIPAVLAELEKCRLDLLGMYNADGANVSQAAKPKKPLASLFSADDYPAVAITGRDQGRVTVSLLVDKAGMVADCSVDSSAGAASLDTMSCYIIQQRATFAPALGSDGKPVRSTFSQAIIWQLGR